MGKVSSAKDIFEKTIKGNEEAEAKRYKPKKLSSSSRTKKKKSVEKKSSHRTKDAEASLDKALNKVAPKSTDKHAEENATLVTEESSTNGSCVFGADEASNTNMFDDDFGAGEADFDFDDDEWEPQVASGKKSRRKSRAPARKTLSQRKPVAQEDSGFEVTFNGNDNHRERIQQSQLRKEGSLRSLNGGQLRKEGSSRSINSGCSAPIISGDVGSLLDAVDKKSHHAPASDLDDDMMSVSSRLSTATATRRASMGRNRRGSMGRSRNTGSAGLQYGSPECEAYINSLPPAFQVSERRRLRQKHIREQERLKQANSAAVHGLIDAHMKEDS